MGPQPVHVCCVDLEKGGVVRKSDWLRWGLASARADLCKPDSVGAAGWGKGLDWVTRGSRLLLCADDVVLLSLSYLSPGMFTCTLHQNLPYSDNDQITELASNSTQLNWWVFRHFGSTFLRENIS